MRLKIRHPYYTRQLVHVRQARLFTDKNCKPVISFRVDKKYELDLANYAVIFTDQKGKELFRTSRLKLQYRYYEEGEQGRKEVKFETEPLEFEDYGEIAIPFARKIFKKISNKKKPTLPKPDTKPPAPLSQYPLWLMRTIKIWFKITKDLKQWFEPPSHLDFQQRNSALLVTSSSIARDPHRDPLKLQLMALFL